MCSITPPMMTRSASAAASTSISIASSRNLSIRTGCAVAGGRRGAQGRDARLPQGHRELERCLAAELDDDAERPLLLDDVQDVLEREGLEVEAIGGVVIGRHGLGVAVDHDRLHAKVPERERGVDAAVVELDPLTDAVRP